MLGSRREGATWLAGLAVATALLVAPLLSAGSASATTLCQINPPGNLCAVGDRYAAGSIFTAALQGGSQATFANSTKCSTSEFALVSGGTATVLPGALSNLTYGTCTSSCVVTVLHLNYEFEMVTSGSGNGKGTIVEDAPNGTPRLKINCGGVCEVEEEEQTLFLTGGNPATLKASGVALYSLTGAPCPPWEYWSAVYSVYPPKGGTGVYLTGP